MRQVELNGLGLIFRVIVEGDRGYDSVIMDGVELPRESILTRYNSPQ